MKKKSQQLPDRNSLLWDSLAGVSPEIGGPILGAMRSKDNQRLRGAAKGLVGGLGGAAVGFGAGNTMAAVARLVLSRLFRMKRVPAALDLLGYVGGGAGGAAGVRLTTTKNGAVKKGQYGDLSPAMAAVRGALDNPVVASVAAPLLAEKLKAALALMSGMGMLAPGQPLPGIRFKPSARRGLLL